MHDPHTQPDDPSSADGTQSPTDASPVDGATAHGDFSATLPSRRTMLSGAAALSAAAAVAAADVLRPNVADAQPQSELWATEAVAPDVIDVVPVPSPDGTVSPASLQDLQGAIDLAASRGGGDVALSAAGDYQLTSPLTIPSNIRVFLGGGVRLVAAAALSEMILVSPGARNSAIIGGSIDGGGVFEGVAVSVSDGFDNIVISGLDVTNDGAGPESRMGGVRFGQGTRGSVINCTFDGLFQCVRNGAAVTDIRVHGCRASNMASRGNLVQLFGEFNRAWITDNVCTGHRSDAVGGHFIQTSGETNGFDHRNLWITGNYFTAIAEAWATDAEGVPIPNGGSGDMIACRSLDGFVVANNILRNAGEYGITAVHGARNGQIRDNLVVDADGSAIVCGTPQNSPVTNVLVAGNTVVRAGVNRAGDLGRVATAAVRFWGAKQCTFTDNTLRDYSRNGLYLQSPAVGEAPGIVDFHHSGNRYFPLAGNSEQEIYDLDTDHGGTGQPNWTSANVI